MEFDSMDDFSGCNDHLIIIKGHRTKRPRPPSPVSRSVTVSGEGSSGLISNAPPSFTTSSDDDHSNETTESTIEDEIMANCLMYLAQSGGCIRQEEVKLANKRFNEVVSDSRTEIKGGLFVYECKTCNRNFPSFQALGGHRASHKRPKIMVQQEDKKAIFTSSSQNLDEEEEEEIGGKFKRLSDDNISPEFTIKLAQKVTVGNQKAKTHECSFCGSEFSSGQALGGHMRRHRNSSNAAKVNINTNIAVETEKPRRVFQLDLNLPAPEDDHRDLKFQFQATASSALVDCHY